MMGRPAARRPTAALTAAIIAVSILLLPAAAQEVDSTALPYDAQMLRLSEILGALHYLERLCERTEGSRWRDQMQALIDAEEPDELRRARMVDAFNRGYGGFRSVYRTCTPAAELAIDRYVEEGAGIAADISTRYGETDG